MSEPQEPPPETPAPKPPIKHNWHRIRVYLWSILLMITMWFCATMLTIQVNPKRAVDALLAQLPFPTTTGQVYWLNRRTLEIDDVKMGGPTVKSGLFFYADSIILTASPIGIWRHHIAKVQIIGGQLFTKTLYATMEKIGSSGKGKSLDWVIGRLEVSRAHLYLNNLVGGITIPVSLGARHPIIINGIRLGKPDESPEMKEERTLEIVNVGIVSPVDPLSRVFYLPLTQIRYTYAEIWHHRIREVDLVRPTMYLGEDLFWLMNQFKSEHQNRPSEGPEAPWKIDLFEIQFGQLAVNAFGLPVVHFPFFFGTKVNNIRLDQLNQISAKAVVPIADLTQDYPDYKVRIVNLKGRLYFSWPPTNAAANNVVNYINVGEVSWNNIAATQVYTTVTFDPDGVYGKMGGKCEGGFVTGNFEFYYTKGFTWNANLFADNINCQPIAQKLAGKYVNLTGKLDGELTVQGKSTEITNCEGSLKLPKPGDLEIKAVDDLVDLLPADMIPLKRDALKLGISAFQYYPYESGELTIGYKPGGGVSSLKLNGPLGRRKFEVYLHPWSASGETVEAQ